MIKESIFNNLVISYISTKSKKYIYRPVQKKSPLFEFPAFLPPTNLGLPMHSPSALTEDVSLNLARFFLLDPVPRPSQKYVDKNVAT